MRDSIVWGGKPRVLAETLFRAPRQNGMQAIQTWNMPISIRCGLHPLSKLQIL